MKQTPSTALISLLPFDIAIKIVLSLEVLDVCALGSCSRLWRELCRSDCLWESLTKQRWPSVSLPFLCNSSSSTTDPLVKGWREIYVRLHEEMAGKATALVEFVEHSSPYDSLEVGEYYKALQDLYSMQLAFTDVQMFLFKPRLNVLLNLVGLHYCIFGLKVPAEHVMDALLSCKVSERQVCVKWWKIGRWFFGFHMTEEPHSRTVSLADLTTEKGEEILKVLHRGAIHEVLRIEISISNAATTPGSCQS
ncbi:uncharacterized protein LOC8262389 [Ricinus communis]|uniref:F-box domain-containing protein n=1 Tax=Ricinus communis TaxID=3988 RepID=B9RT00_RICCO|nr:uncharacterized protein LOC8262389 [Ricinus communis]EEF45483.1 conserved hypothetical protein [Ricinus communis]|eukprot:XP_002516869.1 uncharacterized protein LOC8262389 [Ricinus communis]